MRKRPIVKWCFDSWPNGFLSKKKSTDCFNFLLDHRIKNTNKIFIGSFKNMHKFCVDLLKITKEQAISSFVSKLQFHDSNWTSNFTGLKFAKIVPKLREILLGIERVRQKIQENRDTTSCKKHSVVWSFFRGLQLR